MIFKLASAVAAVAAGGDLVKAGPLAGWTSDGRGGYLLGPKSIEEHMGWHDALNHCTSLGTELVTIRDDEYNHLVASVGAKSNHGGTSDAWINAFRMPTGN